MSQISIPLGIFIGLIASFIQSLGLTIQRKSHVLNQRLPEQEQRLEHRRPLWILGFAIFISSNILGSLVQIASLPVVILAPLGAVSLLWNAFFARLILGDVFSSWMIFATLFIAGGAVLIAIFGIVPEPTRSLEDLLRLFQRPTFVIYFSLLGALVFISLVITHLTEYRLKRKIARITSPISQSSLDITPPMALEAPINPSSLTTGVTDTVTGVITNERTPLLDTKSGSSSRAPSFLELSKYATNSQIRAINRTRLILAISYASFSGIISGMCLLFAKSGVELLLLTVQGQNQFWRWQSWVLVLGLIVFALLQLWYLHKGLVLADPTLVCPSAFCFYNLSSIINGLVYFDQFALISPLHLSLVALGIVVLLIGVWVVSIQAGGEGTLDVPWVEGSALSVENLEVENASGSTPILEEDSGSNVNRNPSLPAEWGMRSEPMMDSVHSPPSDVRAPSRPSSTISSPFLSHESQRSRSSVHRRRPTTIVDTLHHRAPSNTQYNNTLNNLTRPPLSPTLPTVSTLAGTGFQIGLSPFSPGFSVVPLERRRRVSSNLSSGLSPSTSAGNGDPMDNEMPLTGNRGWTEESERRRTVSEGDVKQRDVQLVRERQEEQPQVGETGAEEANTESESDIPIGKGKARDSEGRRSWWKFTRR